MMFSPEEPPPPPAEINVCWSDEQIFSLLSEHTPKSRLPSNVLQDSSPYQHPPSNLPEGVWYLVPSDEKKESIHGFWRADIAEAWKVYSDSTIIGWRTTLQYYKGQAPDEQITDWLMQQYWITKKELCDTDKPKELSLLCRVFLCRDNCSIAEKDLKEITISPLATVGHITDTNSGQASGSDSKGKRDVCQVVESPSVADIETNSPPALSEEDSLSIGDYLELADLEGPISHSSSSQNTSCLSNLSDDVFDASAFLRDIEEEERRIQLQQSSSRCDFWSVGPDDDVILQPAPTSGSVLTNSVRTEVTPHNGSTDESVVSNSAKRHNPAESTIEGTSSDGANGEKKGGTMKKLKMYLCFKPF